MAVIVAGIGCRSACPADAIVRLVNEAATRASVVPTNVAWPAFKSGESGLRDAAIALGLPVILVGDQALRDAQPRCPTHSATARRARGFASVAEAAALAAAGPDAILLLPRITGDGATCALARGSLP